MLSVFSCKDTVLFFYCMVRVAYTSYAIVLGTTEKFVSGFLSSSPDPFFPRDDLRPLWHNSLQESTKYYEAPFYLTLLRIYLCIEWKISHIHLNVHDHSSLWGVRGSNEHHKSKDISTYAAIKLTGPVIYTRSNPNRGFTQVVGLRDSV